MILECDIGNTHTHWRVVGQASGQFSSQLWWQPLALPKDFCHLPLASVKACSVNSAELNAQVAHVVHQRWGLQPQWAAVSAQSHGLINGYEQPQRLGVDRWLALLAAWHRTQGPCMVIDAGTALTVDAVNAAGQHLGGYILPGRSAWLSLFQQHTQGVRPAAETGGQLLTAGQSTTACVLAAQQAALRGCLNAAWSQLPVESAVYVCGGDASWVKMVWSPAEARLFTLPELVLDGLSLCCYTSLNP